MKLFSSTMTTIESALNYSSQKQKLISQNIANSDTPGYKAADISFHGMLQSAVHQQMQTKRSDARHYSFKTEPISQEGKLIRSNVTYNNSGNSVDLDKEMSDLAANQIYYNAMIERMNGKFNSLQTIIRGGK